MGSQQAKQSQEFRFIQVVNDRNFGTIKVYRQLSRPYDYYMKLLLRTESNDPFEDTFLQSCLTMLSTTPRYRFFPQMITPTIASKQCEQMVNSITIEYLNFTLADLFGKMATTKQQLSQQEVNFIIYTVLQAQQVMEQYNIKMAYRPDNLFLNIFGGIVIYPFGLLDDNNLYCQNREISQPQSKLIISQPLICFNQNLCQLIAKITHSSQHRSTYLNMISKIRKCRTVKEIMSIYPWQSKSSIKIGLPGAQEREKHRNQMSRQTIVSYSTSYSRA